jgi:outer membrane protein W
MQIASCLLVTAVLCLPGTGEARQAISPQTVSPPPAPPGPTQQPVAAARGHSRRFGFGANMSATTGGFGVSFRYWLGSRLGVDLTASWIRPASFRGTALERTSSALVAPSAILMLSDFDNTKDVNLRPYVGGGINYAKSSVSTSATLEERDRATGAGGQAFGGLELTFKEAQDISIGVEVVHYWLPNRSDGGTRVNGTLFFYF